MRLVSGTCSGELQDVRSIFGTGTPTTNVVLMMAMKRSLGGFDGFQEINAQLNRPEMVEERFGGVEAGEAEEEYEYYDGCQTSGQPYLNTSGPRCVNKVNNISYDRPHIHTLNSQRDLLQLSIFQGRRTR